ncbi:MAG: hypothetical protein MR601_01380 [Erysipelotrichaceae bacterium]|nr:hypothetical protein [Erysipelotrichaceae bacterium]
MIDINKIVNEVVEKVKANPELISSFTKEPIETVKKLVGSEVNDIDLEKIVNQAKDLIIKNTDINDALKKVNNLFN